MPESRRHARRTASWAASLALVGGLASVGGPVASGPQASPCAGGAPAGVDGGGGWIVVPAIIEGSGHTVTEVVGRVCFGGRMHPPVPGDWSVSIWATPGTATSSGTGWNGRRDYRFAGERNPQNIIIRDGVSEVRFTITVLGDDVVEGDERFTVHAIGLMAYVEIPIPSVKVTIIDDDGANASDASIVPDDTPTTPPSPVTRTPTPSATMPSPRLSVDDVLAREPADGWSTAWLSVQLDRPLAADLAVVLGIHPGVPPASWFEDYVLPLRDNEARVTTVATIRAGDTVALVPVTIKGDGRAEGTERVGFRVVEAPGVVVGRPEGTLSIVDAGAGPCPDGSSCSPPDPSPAASPDAFVSLRCHSDRSAAAPLDPTEVAREFYRTVLHLARTVVEPDTGSRTVRCFAVVTAKHLPLWAGVDHPVSVRIRTAGESAVAGEDFTPLDTRLELQPYQRFAVADLLVMGDGIDEPPETLVVELLEPIGAAIGEPHPLAGFPRQRIEILDPGRTPVEPSSSPVPGEDRWPQAPKG